MSYLRALFFYHIYSAQSPFCGKRKSIAFTVLLLSLIFMLNIWAMLLVLEFMGMLKVLDVIQLNSTLILAVAGFSLLDYNLNWAYNEKQYSLVMSEFSALSSKARKRGRFITITYCLSSIFCPAGLYIL